MDIDSARVVSLPETDRVLSEITRLVDRYGSAIIALNDEPRYLVLDLGQADDVQDISTQELQQVSHRLMERNRAVYRELAK